ncbi:EF-hand domain-containing protein [Aureibaculum marinum]|uniref:EF-hand domain-containing protein n=1 Tax=Aureibaculum marinum TaxID=2487930 RepID=A0A3N4P7I0_9FLAO|nr:EF-hand domain-containing protein [Aureibaculum marinum]RPE00807.1 EF-hand domain-containing protein [Aureibaculum marinum]
MKNKNQKLAISIFLFLLCFGVFAQRPGEQGRRSNGQGGKPDASQILSKLDTNSDNKIDIDEASKDQRSKISQDFDTIDTNDDQYIDLAELEASLNRKNRPKENSAEQIIKEVDDNADGKLNTLEIAAKEKLLLTNNFDEIDTNDDNEIDLEELKAFLKKSDTKKLKKKKR